MQSRRLLVAVVFALAAIASILWDRSNAPEPGANAPQTAPTPTPHRDGTPPPKSAPSDSLASLIGDAREREEILHTLEVISRGGPLPHERDGIVFRNQERRLPLERQRHYREYTVRTPGRRDRGARRLVIGERGEVYYTRDHYASFVRIDGAIPENLRPRASGTQ